MLCPPHSMVSQTHTSPAATRAMLSRHLASPYGSWSVEVISPWTQRTDRPSESGPAQLCPQSVWTPWLFFHSPSRVATPSVHHRPQGSQGASLGQEPAGGPPCPLGGLLNCTLPRPVATHQGSPRSMWAGTTVETPQGGTALGPAASMSSPAVQRASSSRKPLEPMLTTPRTAPRDRKACLMH